MEWTDPTRLAKQMTDFQKSMERTDPTRLAKQMTDFQKTMFESVFNNIATVQDQTGEVVNRLLDQAPWIPEEGKKTISEWVKAYKKGREDYKKMIDDNFDTVGRFFAEPEKKETAKKPEKKEPAKEPEKKESAKSK